MVNGVACLVPAATPACMQCGAQNLWSAPCIDESTFLVTPLCCYKAEGTISIMHCLINYVRYSFIVYMRNCTTAGCPGKLLYDGSEECILNMGLFCITYEVLRNHMYHFFHGRYTCYNYTLALTIMFFILLCS